MNVFSFGKCASSDDLEHSLADVVNAYTKATGESIDSMAYNHKRQCFEVRLAPKPKPKLRNRCSNCNAEVMALRALNFGALGPIYYACTTAGCAMNGKLIWA